MVGCIMSDEFSIIRVLVCLILFNDCMMVGWFNILLYNMMFGWMVLL